MLASRNKQTPKLESTVQDTYGIRQQVPELAKLPAPISTHIVKELTEQVRTYEETHTLTDDRVESLVLEQFEYYFGDMVRRYVEDPAHPTVFHSFQEFERKYS